MTERANGTTGIFVELADGQPGRDPRYPEAIPAYRDPLTGAVSCAYPSDGPRYDYCSVVPKQRADGTTGVFLDLIFGQPALDPVYVGATPALRDPLTGARYC